jgi:hypothetical protein
MHVVHAGSPENVGAAERWNQWQLRNITTSRKDALHARIAFIAIFALLGAWLVRLLLIGSL